MNKKNQYCVVDPPRARHRRQRQAIGRLAALPPLLQPFPRHHLVSQNGPARRLPSYWQFLPW